MKGNFLMGLNFVFIKLYPMRPGATLVSSLLVNTGLILVMTPAILQFCATAFAQYASNSTIFDIFGAQVCWLRSLLAYRHHHRLLADRHQHRLLADRHHWD